MGSIKHENIFEFISIDTGASVETLKDTLVSKGTSAFISFCEKSNPVLMKSELSLKYELKDYKGNTLINKDIPVKKYFNCLLDRYTKDSDFSTSPLFINNSEDILNLYRQKITETLSDFFKNKVKIPDLLNEKHPDINERFSKLLNMIMNSENGISALMKVISDQSSIEKLVRSLNASVITIGMCAAKSSRTTADRQMTAKILEILLILSLEDGKLLCSDYLDESLEKVLDVITETSFMDTPIFKDRSLKTSYYIRVLVTSLIFIELAEKTGGEVTNIDLYKTMYELSESGYADRDIACSIAKLFLPESKAMVLDHAYSIRCKCDNNPTIWTATGDMLPVRIICSNPCGNNSNHKTYIPNDIEIKVNSSTAATVQNGLYFTCSRLTGELQDFYNSILVTRK